MSGKAKTPQALEAAQDDLCPGERGLDACPGCLPWGGQEDLEMLFWGLSLGLTHPPRDHSECYWHLWAEARNAAKEPTKEQPLKQTV